LNTASMCRTSVIASRCCPARERRGVVDTLAPAVLVFAVRPRENPVSRSLIEIAPPPSHVSLSDATAAPGPSRVTIERNSCPKCVWWAGIEFLVRPVVGALTALFGSTRAQLLALGVDRPGVCQPWWTAGRSGACPPPPATACSFHHVAAHLDAAQGRRGHSLPPRLP